MRELEAGPTNGYAVLARPSTRFQQPESSAGHRNPQSPQSLPRVHSASSESSPPSSQTPFRYIWIVSTMHESLQLWYVHGGGLGGGGGGGRGNGLGGGDGGLGGGGLGGGLDGGGGLGGENVS